MSQRQALSKLQGAPGATLIGPEIHVSGRITGREELRIQGTVEGSVDLDDTLIIDESGVARADLRAVEVIVHGIVVGSIVADRRIVLHPGARVVGDLKAPRVVVASGAALRGQVVMGEAGEDGGAHEGGGGFHAGSGHGRWRGSTSARGSASSGANIGRGAQGIGRSRAPRSPAVAKVMAAPASAVARPRAPREREEPGPRRPPLRQRIAQEFGRDREDEETREVVAPPELRERAHDRGDEDHDPVDSTEYGDDGEFVDGEEIDVDDEMVTTAGGKKRAARPRVPARGKHTVDHA